MIANVHRCLIPLKINQVLAIGSGMIQRPAILCKIICLFFVGEVCSPCLTQSAVRAVGQEDDCLEQVWQKHSLALL